ncbi:MAG: nitroreductase family protein [Candidatus Omnitrophica bacterium]|nr:nitroreductase family protein [Candidatus Omnitrophota bacterium]
METFDSIERRASVRGYQSKAVSKELLERVVDAGRRAPTARGEEPWEFVVIVNKETLKELGGIANSGSFIKDAAACIAIFCRDTKYYLEDGCAATENILIAAQDLGLGACWVAGDKKPYIGEVSRLLAAPQGSRLISLISLGWPAEKIKQNKTRQLRDVLHWERF